MTLMEDETTVENGDMLRAATYNLMTADETGEDSGADDTAAASSTTIKYFPVTLYDYDAATINDATREVEIQANPDLTQWDGMYFSGGTPANASYNSGAKKITPTFTEDGKAVLEDGDYLLIHRRSGQAMVGGATTGITGTGTWSDASVWTITATTDGYTVAISSDTSTTQYMNIANGTSETKVQETSNEIEIVSFTSDNDADAVMLKQGSYYLNQYGGSGSSAYGGYNNSSDYGSVFYLYKVTGEVHSTGSLSHGEWNSWSKNTGNKSDGDLMYTGLVESTLDTNKNIVFTKPEGGIFNTDSSVKDIYTNVEMPFVYEDGYYTFDASEHGVYFHEDSIQKSSGTAGNNTRLYFDNENVQKHTNMNYADGSSTMWIPFNDGISFESANVNYHFGMKATIPFTMTPNGRINATDDTSEAITFSFSGDDDVWVFIDGQLVIDLGGIHNRLDAQIDFADNTVIYSENNTYDTDNETGSYNDAEFSTTKTLFTGLISQDRTTFAATEKHELTIFYLERGAGSSNSEIRFNLPVNDSITVTKDATRSWYEKTQKEEPLTASEQAIVNNIDFTFTLYQGIQNEDGEIEYSVLPNTNYYLLNSDGQVIDNPSTDENGKFSLKNGQSAKFITTQINTAGETGIVYYVQEDKTPGFTQPDYNYSGEAAGGFRYQTTGGTYEGHTFEAIDQTYIHASDIPEYEVYDGTGASGKVTVYGSEEANDSLVFICSNYMNADLPNPSARPVDDKIVIDYGLPDEIDVLANDVYRGDSIELLSVTGEGMEIDTKTGEITTEGAATKYGTAVLTEEGKVVYTLDKQLTGVEVLNYVVKVKGTTTTEATQETKEAYEYAVAKVYIIPATTMYYEENFTGFVTYAGSGWTAEYTIDSTYQNAFQEPGVVGTIGDSPYGSDVAYLNDSKDSNGTSRYASTTNGAVKFEYTFTGTGTSFFARTTNNTGYMKIVVTDITDPDDPQTIQSFYRDTVYLTEDDNVTLYNVPVFTTDGLSYGTYKVTVTVAKKTVKTNSAGEETVLYHSDFWLDGIRITQPLDITDTNYSTATAAYASDSEQNMKYETLRNKLIRDEADWDYENDVPVWPEDGNFVLFTDVNGELQTAEEYESIGPKEEVYLNKGQSISFSLADWDPNSNKIYLGMKAPFGNGTATVGSTTIEVNNAADCYYDITSYGTITTDSNGVKNVTYTITATDRLISVTNIKVTGSTEFVIIPGNDVSPANNVEVIETDEGTDVNVDGYEASGSDS